MSSKCEMARLRYCSKSMFGYCCAGNSDMEKCPYLQAISEVARLSIEKNNIEDELDDGR